MGLLTEYPTPAVPGSPEPRARGWLGVGVESLAGSGRLALLDLSPGSKRNQLEISNRSPRFSKVQVLRQD